MEEASCINGGQLNLEPLVILWARPQPHRRFGFQRIWFFTFYRIQPTLVTSFRPLSVFGILKVATSGTDSLAQGGLPMHCSNFLFQLKSIDMHLKMN